MATINGWTVEQVNLGGDERFPRFRAIRARPDGGCDYLTRRGVGEARSQHDLEMNATLYVSEAEVSADLRRVA